MESLQMDTIVLKIKELIAVFGLKIVAAAAIFFIGRILVSSIVKFSHKVLEKSGVDETLRPFICNILHIVLYVVVIIASLNQIGIETTSLVAVLGAAGLAVGLALQGSLSNFAAGTMIIVFRPFKVGDFVEIAGVAGVIQEIQIFTTYLKTGDNKKIIIPNGNITGGNIINYSAMEKRRVDLVFGISYTDSIDTAKDIIKDVLEKDERIFKDPIPVIGVLELADSSVNIAVRPWVKTADYWNVYFYLNETIKKEFDAKGITIPFPQRDVHMYNEKA